MWLTFQHVWIFLKLSFFGTTEYLKAWGIPPKVMTFDTCKEYVCAVRQAPKRAPRATHPAQSRSKCHSLVVFCLCNQAFLFPFIGLGFVVVLCFLFSPLSLSLFISLCLHHPSPKQLNHLLGPRRIILVFYSSSRDSLINLVLGLTLSAATLRKVLRHIRRGFWRRASSDASTPCTHTPRAVITPRGRVWAKPPITPICGEGHLSDNPKSRGDQWGRIRLPPHKWIYQRRYQSPTAAARTLDEQASTAMARWTIGQTPIAVLLAEHLTKKTIIGLYRQGNVGNNFLPRLRHTYSGLLVSHILVNIVGAKLKETGGPCKIFTDRVPAAKGEGKGQRTWKWGGGRKGRGRGRGRSRSPTKRGNKVLSWHQSWSTKKPVKLLLLTLPCLYSWIVDTILP